MHLIKVQSLIAVAGADNLLSGALNSAQATAQAWDKQWQTIFQSQLYASLVAFSGLIAAGSLIFFMMQFLHLVIEKEDWTSALQKMLLPLAVIAVLANNAALLSGSVQAMRAVIHQQANGILQITLADVKIEDAIRSATLGNGVASELRTQMSQCYGLAGQKQTDCLNNAAAQIQKTLDALPGNQRQTGFLGTLNVLLKQIQNGLDVINSTDPVTGGPVTAGNPLAGFLGSAFQDLASGLLLAFGWAFSNTLELALLLNALIGPIAVAGSLALDYKPFLAWLTGFFSLGLAMICYNIITGLAAWVVVTAGISDMMGFLVILGLLAPALALALAAGGGITTFNAISSGSAGIISSVINVVPAISRTSRGASA